MDTPPPTQRRAEALDEPTAFHDMRAELDADTAESSQPSAAGRLVLPETLGDRYRVGALIGRGGMAEVFRGHDEVLDRPVAIKVLRGDAEGDRQRFLREARVLARLSHPRIVSLLDAGLDDTPYLIMDLVEGAPLTPMLTAPMEPVRLAEVSAEIAEALSYAHGQDVIHRDVKPGNVLIAHDGSAQLADFGIARMAGDYTNQTNTGTIIGSVHYLAPEQVSAGEVTPAVDVYALGMLMLRAITGKHAFEGSNVEAAVARLHADPPIPEHLDSEWRDLLTAMTARAPEDRPTAAEAAIRLQALATRDEIGRTAVMPVLATQVGAPAITPAAAAAAPPAPPRTAVAAAQRWERWKRSAAMLPVAVGLTIATVLLVAGVVPDADGTPAPTQPETTEVTPLEPVMDSQTIVVGREMSTGEDEASAKEAEKAAEKADKEAEKAAERAEKEAEKRAEAFEEAVEEASEDDYEDFFEDQD